MGEEPATKEELVAQIRGELLDMLEYLDPLLGPDLAGALRDRVIERADNLADQLRSDDESTVESAVVDLMNSLWLVPNPAGNPPKFWWKTPLGQVVAHVIDGYDLESVTPGVAAAMLGVSQRRVFRLLREGKLDRHPDGGVLRVSVLQRIAGGPEKESPFPD